MKSYICLFYIISFIILLSSQWRPKSRYCVFIVKLGTCPFRGHLMNSKSFCLSGGHYVAAGFVRFILYIWLSLH